MNYDATRWDLVSFWPTGSLATAATETLTLAFDLALNVAVVFFVVYVFDPTFTLYAFAPGTLANLTVTLPFFVDLTDLSFAFWIKVNLETVTTVAAV